MVDGRFPTEVALALAERPALEALVDHSLVQFDAAEGRYLLLETIREYAGRLLAASGGGTAAHRRLLDWAVGFAKEVRDGLERAAPDVLRRVDAADAAIASALAWPVVAGQGREAAAAVAVDIAFGWSLRGRCAEGLAQVRRLAALFDPVPPALAWAEAFLMAYSGEMEPAVAIAAAAAEAATDDRTRARALTLVGTVMQFVDPVGASRACSRPRSWPNARATTGAASKRCRCSPTAARRAPTWQARRPPSTPPCPPSPASGTRSCGRGTPPSAPRSRSRQAGSPRPWRGARKGSGSRSPSGSR